MKGLQGKVAIVTGAAMGIGKAIAERLRAEGCRLALVDVAEAEGRRVAAALQGLFCHCNVAEHDQVVAMVGQVQQHYGQIDILVNNAAIHGPLGPAATVAPEAWHQVTGVNLSGVFYTIQQVLPHMQAQGGGAIVNIASVSGAAGALNKPAYAAAKGGVVNLTRAVAMDYAAQHIRVNAVAPSVVPTPMLHQVLAGLPEKEAIMGQLENHNPLPGFVTPEAVADAVAFLASNEARFITGHTLPVDGGLLARE